MFPLGQRRAFILWERIRTHQLRICSTLPKNGGDFRNRKVASFDSDVAKKQLCSVDSEEDIAFCHLTRGCVVDWSQESEFKTDEAQKLEPSLLEFKSQSNQFKVLFSRFSQLFCQFMLNIARSVWNKPSLSHLKLTRQKVHDNFYKAYAYSCAGTKFFYQFWLVHFN